MCNQRHERGMDREAADDPLPESARTGRSIVRGPHVAYHPGRRSFRPIRRRARATSDGTRRRAPCRKTGAYCRTVGVGKYLFSGPASSRATAPRSCVVLCRSQVEFGRLRRWLPLASRPVLKHHRKLRVAVCERSLK